MLESVLSGVLNRFLSAYVSLLQIKTEITISSQINYTGGIARHPPA
jgi:hypothetical protein